LVLKLNNTAPSFSVELFKVSYIHLFFILQFNTPMNKHLHLQYYNSHTLLLINQQGKIRMLYTPFRVICVIPTERIAQGLRVYVDEVVSNKQDELLYVIFNAPYSYKYFKLPVMF
jgi:hypothetical protein